MCVTLYGENIRVGGENITGAISPPWRVSLSALIPSWLITRTSRKGIKKIQENGLDGMVVRC